MNRIIALVWGAFTIAPLIYFFYFMASMSSISHAGTQEEAMAQFDHIMNLHMLNIALIFGLIISYIVYLFKTNHVPQEKKTLWAVVLFMGNIISMPIFWFHYVWRAPEEKENATASS